ncbi:MAG: AAA family ATPase, partial [Elusimicrobiales bacterium]|nr:AAA family ATPase [Elusimicrobiales bacterium]
MSKIKKIYICNQCGHKEIKWQGKCPQCGEWNSFEEDVIEETSSKSKTWQLTEFSSPPQKLSEIKSSEILKKPTNIEELDRVLDGGIVEGQIILIAGVPGIGKSTLLMEVASSFAIRKEVVLYVSGEESINQIAHRAERLNIKNQNIIILCETDIIKIKNTIDEINPKILIIDSIQTLYHPEISSSPSSPLQIKYVTSQIIKIAKNKGIITFILAHVTKEGDIAGPKILEHMVDTVLYFESDLKTHYRILRSFKNRFGS